MKQWKRGRLRLSAWRMPTDNHLLDVLPAVRVMLGRPADWCRLWSLGLTFSWLCLSVGVSVEVRHG